MVKGTEKINMILFGQKFVSEFLKAMPRLSLSRV